MARTADEIFAELFALEDQGEVSRVLLNNDNQTLKDVRSKQFAAGKKEGEKGLKTLQARALGVETLDAALELVQTLGAPEEKVAEVRSKVPDRAALEKDLADKYAGKLSEREKTIAKQRETIKSGARARALGRFTEFLTVKGPDKEQLAARFPKLQLGDVHGEYAHEVLATRYAGAIEVDDDGNVVNVMKPGEQTGYDGATLDEKLALLAADVRKTVSTTFLLSSADRGAGVRSGTVAGTPGQGSGADAVVQKKAESGLYQPI